MTTTKLQLGSYKKYLLNRLSAKPTVTEYVESCLASEDEAAKYSFHKIMVHNWADGPENLFNCMAEYFSSVFLPVHVTIQSNLTVFYTSSLSLVLKLSKLDFMFPYERNMYNVDVLFNDKNAADLFDNWVSVDDVVSSVVSNRLNEHFELNLSDFSNDPEFLEKKICFYNVGLLSQYKILMIRIGRGTKLLNLSNNNLSQVPQGVLNFFIKSDLVGINLSNNNIPSLTELYRISSKIEKIWIEGNPLCEEIDSTSYVKQITRKFPRVTEIDGIKLHASGYPFFRNFMVTSDKNAKMLIEKFLSLYFSHFDNNRDKVVSFYNVSAKLSITADFEKENKTAIAADGKNRFNRRSYDTRSEIMKAFKRCLPTSEHDPSTFCVDLILYEKNCIILTVDGIFRGKQKKPNVPRRHIAFRRTFVFNTHAVATKQTTMFYIVREMISLRAPTKEEVDNSFKYPIRNMVTLELVEPKSEEIDTLCKAFCHLTHLKRDEVEARLMIVNWDMKKAIKNFLADMKGNLIDPDKFTNEEEDLSDISSLSDEVD